VKRRFFEVPTYRTDDRPGFKCYTLAELDGCEDIHTPTDKPQCDWQPLGEWYCTNVDCVIREVQILCKLLDLGDRVPEMRCPGCGSALKFHHWLKVDTLLKVSDE
jgi:hypothetical protein